MDQTTGLLKKAGSKTPAKYGKMSSYVKEKGGESGGVW